MVRDEDDYEATDEMEEPEDVEADAEELPLPGEEEDDGDESSLEELLAQRAAARRGGADDADEDDDLMSSLASEKEHVAPVEPLPSRAIPLKDRQEFVCNNCHLVKAKVQLADPERGLCRDCV